MPFNKDDYTAAPWAAGVMELTHDECVYVIDKCKEVAAGYTPENPWDNPEPDKTYIISNYNKIDNWEKAVNGDTYDVLMVYDIDNQTDGIGGDPNGENSL